MKKEALASALAFMLLALPAVPAQAGAQATKNEIIYATYDADGGNAAYSVVNRFELGSAQQLTDYGVYQQVTNLTSTAPMQVSGDEITVQANAGVFYYEGVLSRAQLPWLISVEYRLNGIPISPANLAGRSGPVEITLRVRENDECPGDYFDHYALSITAAFDEENCCSVEAKNGIVASAGSKKQVSFTVMPGSEPDLSITMDAVQFAMDPISMGGVPMSMEIGGIDTSSLKEEMTDLEQGAVELDDGVGKLRDGVYELSEGTGELSEGSGVVSEAMSTLRSAATTLRRGSAQMAEGIGELSDAAALLESYHAALLSGTAALTDPQTQSLLAQANAGLDAYADPNTGLPAKGAELSAGVHQMAAAADAMIEALNLLADFIDRLDAASQGMSAYGAAVEALPGASEDIGRVIAMLSAARSELGAIMTPAAQAQIDAAVSLLSGAQESIRAVQAGYSLASGSSTLAPGGNLSALSAALRQMASELDEALYGETGLVSGVDAYVAAVNDYIALVTAYQNGMNQINEGAQELSEGVEAYLEGVSMLCAGIYQLEDSYEQMSSGIKSFTGGVIKLADNYASLDEGIQSLVDGVTELTDGVEELASGTLELRENTSGAGDRVDEEVDKALERYKNEDYTAPSFTSEKNHPTLVQFVIKYKGVTLPEKTQAATEEVSSLNQLRSLLDG